MTRCRHCLGYHQGTCAPSFGDEASIVPFDPQPQPVVDTEAAAVWERLPKRARKDLCELVHYQAGGAMSFRPRNIAPLQRADVVGVNGWPNDLGRRVVAHGERQRKADAG